MEEIYQANKIFNGDSFTDKPLEKGEYEQCEFINCIFYETNLSQINFIECTFNDCNLSLINLKNTSLQTIEFKNCKLLGIDFSICNDESMFR